MRQLLKLSFLLLLPSVVLAEDLVTENSTSVCHDVFFSDSGVTTGAGKTGIAFGTPTCKFKKSTQTNAQITTITLVDGTVGTFLQNSWKEEADGWYQICLPDTTWATGPRYVTIWCNSTGAAQMNLKVNLTAQYPTCNIKKWNDTLVTGTGPISSIFYRN